MLRSIILGLITFALASLGWMEVALAIGHVT